jgi:predicted metal-dependent enzyme (double-stranded beta helix superfamily)
MQAITHRISPLRDFVISMTHLVNKTEEEPVLVSQGSALLKELITNDSWLPDFCTINHPEYYQQFLLHTDPLERFSVVSFVWGPDHKTPIHDHCVWGLIGMMRGSEISQRYKRDSTGKLVPDGPEAILKPGEVEAVSPDLGDIHVVRNASSTENAISIHVYGANIGAVNRHTYHKETGEKKTFVSGYSSAQIPNLWDRSANPKT